MSIRMKHPLIACFVTILIANIFSCSVTDARVRNQPLYPNEPPIVARPRYHPPDPNMETVVNLVAVWAIAYSACKGARSDSPQTKDKCAEADRTSTALRNRLVLRRNGPSSRWFSLASVLKQTHPRAPEL